MLQKSGSCADRNELCMNAGRPCHRDRQIAVVHELRQCELAQGRHQSSLVLDHEHSQRLEILASLRDGMENDESGQ